MDRILTILFFGIIYSYASAQNPSNEPPEKLSIYSRPAGDTLKSFFVKKQPPYLYTVNLNHRGSSLWNKMVRGNFYVMGYNIGMGTYLILAPEYVTKWHKKDKFQLTSILHQYEESFTKPPVIDKDLFVVNYIGHPYQGGYYYNAVRSQGATFLQSSLFCIGQSLLWEYGWEGGMEQPSIQDLLTTPLAGILVGELSHVVTIKMGKNGFRWYEIALVCIINPTFAINNRFKFR